MSLLNTFMITFSKPGVLVNECGVCTLFFQKERKVIRMYILEDGYEQVDQQYVGNQKVAGHDSWDNPGAGLTGRQGHHRPILCGDVLPTGGCTPTQKRKKKIKVYSKLAKLRHLKPS